MGILSRGMAMLSRTQSEADGVTVTYQRTLQPSFSVSAVIGRTVFDQEEDIDMPIRVSKKDVDFIIRVEDFETAQTTAGVEDLFRPDEGDLITRSVTILGATATTRYRVYKDSNIPAWDWGEQEQLTYRIHARAEK